MNPATKGQNQQAIAKFVRIGVVHKGALIVETCIEKHADIKIGIGRDCAVRVPKARGRTAVPRSICCAGTTAGTR